MTRIATKLASWGRNRLPSAPPLPAVSQAVGSGPIPDQSGNIGVGAEIYLGALGWVDISPYIYYRDGSVKVAIRRGAPDEVSRAQAQTCAFQLNNRDFRFSPRNPTGPLYGLIGRNTKIRFWRMQNGIRRYRYAGEMPEWPSNADITLTDVYVQATAYGPLRRLTQGTKPVQSALYRAYTKSSAVPNVVAYWPCEDGTGAAAFGSALSSASPMVFSGSPTLAGSSVFPCSSAIPVVNNSVWSGSPPPASWTDNVLRFLLAIPSGGDTNGATIARMYTTGTVKYVELVYNTASGGELTYRGIGAGGSTLFTLGPFLAPDGSGFNGKLLRVSLDLINNGSGGITYQCQHMQVVLSALFTGGQTNGTLAASSVGPVTQVVFNPGAQLVGTAIGHVSLQSAWDTLFDLVGPVNAWDIDGATARLARLCSEENVQQVTVGDYDPSSDATLMGPQLPGTFPDLVQQCVDVDTGILFEARDQVALAYRPLSSLVNQGTAYNTNPNGLVLDFAANQLSAAPVPRDDDYYTRNDVTAQQTNGTTARQVLTSGALSIQDPPSGVGEYQSTYPINVGPDGFFAGQASMADHAAWRLHLGTVDEPRYPSVSLNLRHPQFTGNTALLNAALTLDIGDRIQLLNPPPQLPPDTASLIVRGYSESLGAFEHDMVLVCSPESPYRVGVADDWVLSRADTDGTTLAAALAPTDTRIGLSTTNPLGQLWTTNPASFPFDLAIAGERLTAIGPGTTRGVDPFQAQGTAQYLGQNAALSMDASRPFPTNADGLLNPYATRTILVTPAGGSSASVVAQPDSAGSIVTSTSYTAWAWVYNAAGRSYQVFINWFNNGSFVSTSLATSTAVTAGVWTLLQFAATSPGAGVNQLAVGVNDPGTPTASQTWNIWGLNATATANLTQTNPQFYTAARAVNGVSKPQAAGADVRLWQPAGAALY